MPPERPGRDCTEDALNKSKMTNNAQNLQKKKQIYAVMSF